MKRVWLIDFLRGLAVLMMIVFHSLFYLDYFGFAKIDLYSGIIGRFQMLIPLLFIFLSGVSSKIQLKSGGKKAVLLRGLKILGMGMLITIATLILFPDNFVFFGILHLIGLCVILSVFFSEYFALIFGTIILFISNMVNNSIVTNKYLSIFGFKYLGLNTFDYYPLIPWLGIFLLGFYSSKFILKLKPSKLNSKAISVVNWFGRHSLIIYFSHIIILFSFFWMIKQFFQ